MHQELHKYPPEIAGIANYFHLPEQHVGKLVKERPLGWEAIASTFKQAEFPLLHSAADSLAGLSPFQRGHCDAVPYLILIDGTGLQLLRRRADLRKTGEGKE